MKDLTGDDLVKIINAAGKASMSKIKIGDIELHFDKEEPAAVPATTSFMTKEEYDKLVKPEEEASPEDEELFNEMQLAVTDPVAWEESQVKDEE